MFLLLIFSPEILSFRNEDLTHRRGAAGAETGLFNPSAQSTDEGTSQSHAWSPRHPHQTREGICVGRVWRAGWDRVDVWFLSRC